MFRKEDYALGALVIFDRPENNGTSHRLYLADNNQTRTIPLSEILNTVGEIQLTSDGGADAGVYHVLVIHLNEVGIFVNQEFSLLKGI